MLRRPLLAVAALAGALLAAPVGPAAAAPSGPCTDPSGVTVVVDATEIGGEVSVGCATAPTTGTDALEKAGFTATRDAASMICAIDAQPDPCPATFTGQYWSYWFVQDGAWQTYMEGSDTTKPAAGAIEGWRWADGSTPPEADPATLVAAAAGADDASASAEPTEGAGEGSPAAEPTDQPTDEATVTALGTEPAQDEQGGVPSILWVVVGVVVVAGVVVLVVRGRRAA